MLKRIKVKTQHQQNDCGACCLAMILSYYGYSIDTTDITKIKNTSCGWSMKDIKNIACLYNLNSTAFKVSNIEEVQFLDKPLILFWDFSHFVVLEKISKKLITIIDPNYGRSKLSYEEFYQHFSNYALSFSPSKEFIKNKISCKQRIKQVIKSRIWSIDIPYMYILLLVLYNISIFFIPICTSRFIEHFNSKEFNWYYFMILISVFLLILSVGYFLEYMKNKTRIELEQQSTGNILKKIFSKNLTDISSYQSGDILSRIYSNSDLCMLFAVDIPNMLFSSLLILGMFIYLFFINGIIAVSILTIIICLMGINLLFVFPMIDLSSNEIFFLSKLRTNITEGIVSFRFLKSAGITNKYLEKIQKNMNRYLKSSMNKNKIASGALAVQQSTTLFFSLIISIIGIGFIKIYPRESSNITLIITIGMVLFSPCMQIISSIIRIITAYPNIQRILDLVNTNDLVNKNKVKTIKTGEINVEKLTFGYSEMSSPLFSNFNLFIEDGSKVIIHGESGAGKTTLINLILGLEKRNYIGNITVGGINPREEDLNLRDDICYISQNEKIFTGNLKSNIKLHCDSYSFENLLAILDKLGLEDCFSSIISPEQIRILENGSNFSSGQKQRLYLLRLFLKKYKIIIVDEPTSNLDSETSRMVFNELNKLTCTRVIITHDKNLIKHSSCTVKIG